ncbi:MAG: glycerol-3-phosphate 1-O-acyltransferase PlsY [Solirubrobacteraceae bacterium]
MTELLLKAALSYLLGSIVGSLLVGRLRGGVDIRRLGSGNAGGTNALRTQGKAFAFWVLAIDIGKGWIATGLLAPARLPGLQAQPQWRHWSVAACGIAVMLGHVYPLWHGLRGGKGVATLVGAVLGAAPILLAPMLAVWLLAVTTFGFIGLASVLGAATFAVAVASVHGSLGTPLFTFAVASALLIALTHRSNLSRMLAGTEPRARRLWLLGAGRKQRGGGH